MLDLFFKKVLIILGLTVGSSVSNQDMVFYKQKLNDEIMMEQKLQSEIESLEYRKMWDDANKTEDTDFASSWWKDKKNNDKLDKNKKYIITVKKRIKVLKQIIITDSLKRVKIEPITL
jgi:NDP-sugar pyrophosphorylase family protein